MAADLTMTGTPRLAQGSSVKVTVIAGEAINAGDSCFIHTDGLAYQCDSADHASGNISFFEGISVNAVSIGSPVTLWGIGSKIYMTDTVVTIGSFWYVGANEGVLYDTKVATSDTALPVGKFITAHVMEVVRGGR